MSFATEFKVSWASMLVERSRHAALRTVRAAAAKNRLSLGDFADLISPAAGGALELLGQRARQLTQQRFGKVIRLFAPLYLSNECINNCRYCGFSRDNPILRVTLGVDEVRQEARALVTQGFRNILLVSGEHPKFVSNNYLADCVRAVRDVAP
ncbi:MAG TPA: 2-iminoacetate synthase ThiH, partial [Patescibacteria group bacterium]|nr:2-iminoacetate synthase ThiH [Patescibacteria group bacterium]